LSLPARPDPPARPQIAPTELAVRVQRLAGGERLTLIGLGRDRLGEILVADGDGSRGVLLLAVEDLHTTAAILERILDDLADLALARWPHWTEPGASGSALSASWRDSAFRRAESGQPPRFRRLPAAREFAELLAAIDPAGVVLAAEIDPAAASRAAPVIEALEWCAGHGAAVVAALPSAPPEEPPYPRILYGAHGVRHAPAPAAARFIAPRSRAHHASLAEQRVEAALHGDPELAGLFAGNATVPVGAWGGSARVDLLCRTRRVVVELDGPEHRTPHKFAEDRHRDYELLVAGYLVLRITNDEVEADLTQAVEKIRAVVRLRAPRENGSR
jgi:very-short-patch-repair endonuclease